MMLAHGGSAFRRVYTVYTVYMAARNSLRASRVLPGKIEEHVQAYRGRRRENATAVHPVHRVHRVALINAGIEQTANGSGANHRKHKRQI
jgi:hypothetical protein